MKNLMIFFMLMEVSVHAGFTVEPRFNYERFKEEKNEEQ